MARLRCSGRFTAYRVVTVLTYMPIWLSVQGVWLFGLWIYTSSDRIVLKGMNKDIDSYSAFFDNAKKAQTELDGLLKANGVTDVYACGVLRVCSLCV